MNAHMTLTEHLTDTNRGTFLEVDGRPALRFRRTYPHPVEKVWAAVSTPAGLKHWFPGTVTLEPQEGGAMTFDMDPNAPAGTGTVLTWQPPNRFSFTWYEDEVHVELDAEGEGCVLTLTNVLSEKDAAARNGAGWSVCLGELTRHLDGVPDTDPNEAGTDLWQPLFEAYAAAGMPAGAPIPKG
jgi:uncharacterized protein YndB with AHSA1/START domain